MVSTNLRLASLGYDLGEDVEFKEHPVRIDSFAIADVIAVVQDGIVSSMNG